MHKVASSVSPISNVKRIYGLQLANNRVLPSVYHIAISEIPIHLYCAGLRSHCLHARQLVTFPTQTYREDAT